MAILDWLVTFMGAYLLSVVVFSGLTYFGLIRRKKYNFQKLFYGTFLLSVCLAIFLHHWFGINTMLGYYLGLNSYHVVKRCLTT
jgi:hypothetical protein